MIDKIYKLYLISNVENDCREVDIVIRQVNAYGWNNSLNVLADKLIEQNETLFYNWDF